MGAGCMSQNTSPDGPVEILNCQKPRGLEALRQNRIALKAIERDTVLRFLAIADDKPSRIDGFIWNQNTSTITGIYEVKSRNYGLEKLESTYSNEWMISWSKLQAALDITKHTKLPFWGVLHLEPDGLVLMVEIFNENATWGCNVQLRNKLWDGVEERMAFLNMSEARKHRIVDNQTELF
jgi:hypothetical protein